MNRNVVIVTLLIVISALIVIVVMASANSVDLVDEDNGLDDHENGVEEDLIDDTDDENDDLVNGGNDQSSDITDMDELVSCLKTAGVVIYGSVTCPFCKQLVDSFGGYDVVDAIYVECSVYPDRCTNELIGRGVPEIQIEGEMYQGSRKPEEIGSAVGCEFSG